jgi:hypothetical protein
MIYLIALVENFGRRIIDETKVDMHRKYRIVQSLRVSGIWFLLGAIGAPNVLARTRHEVFDSLLRDKLVSINGEFDATNGLEFTEDGCVLALKNRLLTCVIDFSKLFPSSIRPEERPLRVRASG